MTADALAMIAKGDGSAIAGPRRAIVRDAEGWRALWAAHAGPNAAPPAVDFAADMVAAVFAGDRPTPGFEIEITEAVPNPSGLALVVRERFPAPGLAAAQVIVSPFHIVRLPRHDGDVRFVDADRAAPPVTVPPVPAPQTFSANAPSSTGLDPNLAAALAYLAGPFSGVLILLVERANGYVRFHAWQSIVALGGLGLLSVGALIFSFMTLLISPFLFTVMYRLSEVLAIAWVGAWVVCLVKAFTGDRWEMPVAGRYASRLATRHV